MDDRSYILANLHLHAVLPRLEELVKLDHEAHSIAKQMKLKVRFKARKGPSEVVEIADGCCGPVATRSCRRRAGWRQAARGPAGKATGLPGAW